MHRIKRKDWGLLDQRQRHRRKACVSRLCVVFFSVSS